MGGLFSGTVTCLRFLVEGEAKEPGSYEQAIEARRFLPLSPTGETSESCGWVAPEAPFDDTLALTRDVFSFGERIAISYREDAFRIPRALLKRETKKRIAEIVASEKRDPDSISRGFAKAVEASVLVNLKGKSLPRSRVVDVAWDCIKGEVRVYARGTIATERIASLFERTFGVRIELASPASRTAVALGKEAAKRLPPSSIFGSAVGDVGAEFVTWAYFNVADQQSPAMFAIGKRARLRTVDASGPVVALTGAGIEGNGEVQQAIRRGALIDTLSLEMAIESRVYAFTLRGDDGGLVGVHLPDLFTEETKEETEAIAPTKRKPKLPLEDILTLRADAMGELEDVVDGLFGAFLETRKDPAMWRDATAMIRRRVTLGLEARNPA